MKELMHARSLLLASVAALSWATLQATSAHALVVKVSVNFGPTITGPENGTLVVTANPGDMLRITWALESDTEMDGYRGFVFGVDTAEVTRDGASALELTGQGFDPFGNPNAPNPGGEDSYNAFSDGAPIGFAGNGGELWRIDYTVTAPFTDASADISLRFDDVFQCHAWPGPLCPGTPGTASLRIDADPSLAKVPFAPASVISTVGNAAWAVFPADVDRDGDVDVVSASGNDLIAWHENDGASPPGWTTRTISTATALPTSVYAADVDSDGDLDVMSASRNDDRIAWYENDGATPPGWTPRTISTAADDAFSVFAADVDSDGDVDVLSASLSDNEIAWYENDGALPPGWTARTISTAMNRANSVFAADVDGDGDIDVLSASQLSDKISWYENDGASPPSWTDRTISTAADGAYSVFAADVDGDGDVDALSASRFDNEIAWYENDGVSPPGWTARTISTTAANALSVFAAEN